LTIHHTEKKTLLPPISFFNQSTFFSPHHLPLRKKV
jgi:hypothetical protein